MTTLLIALAVGFLGGMAIGFQGPLASLMSQRIGVVESAFFVHVSGTIVAAVALLFLGGGKLAFWRSVPWYALWCGALGLILIAAISYTIPRIGVVATSAVIITAQMVLGSVLDHFGALGMSERPIDLSRVVGILVLFLGTWLISR